MTQKEKLETLTGETFPEPTPQPNYRKQMEGTPWWIIQTDKGWNLVMGKYRLNNEPLPTQKDLTAWIDYNYENILLSQTICVVTDMLNNQQHQTGNERQKQHKNPQL